MVVGSVCSDPSAGLLAAPATPQAQPRPKGLSLLRLPPGCYYLADAGYSANSDLLLTPYQKTRYHLREQGIASEKPATKQELRGTPGPTPSRANAGRSQKCTADFNRLYLNNKR